MRLDTSMMLMLMILLSAIVLVVFTSPLMMSVYGQTQTQAVQEVQEQVQQNNAQIDSTTLVAGGTAAGTIATFLTAYLKGKKLDKSDKRTDKDTGLSLLYLYRLIQTMDAMLPDVSKCLDQPFNSDPMQKHITIRMKLAEDANTTAAYLMTNLNAVVPSMTPSAAVIVADAASSNPAKTTTTIQTPPANTNTNTTN